MTLSHCWGDAVILKLKKTTIQNLRSRITLSSLPLTFQHAAEVARRLQKRYIWIDSLCIFQNDDDKTDWLKEAAVMDKVYSHCFLNIAATGAIDSSKGLFMTRDPASELKPTRISCPMTVTSNGEPGPTDVLFLERELMGAPLNRRAWGTCRSDCYPLEFCTLGLAKSSGSAGEAFSANVFPDSLPGFMERLRFLARGKWLLLRRSFRTTGVKLQKSLTSCAHPIFYVENCSHLMHSFIHVFYRRSTLSL